MSERIFTRAEANDLLPRLRSIFSDLHEAWRLVRELQPEIEKLKEKAQYDAFHARGIDYVESLTHVMVMLSQVRELGVLLKDLDKGLCDFPYMKDRRVVYLCWQLGEDSIDFWHDVETGFGSREPLEETDE